MHYVITASDGDVKIFPPSLHPVHLLAVSCVC